jgi:hypothetical protein
VFSPLSGISGKALPNADVNLGNPEEDSRSVKMGKQG